tara:strand:+ start:66 stop:290 length:225 start_codon:yes stop_codon:yes gene_type:complete
MKNILNTVTEFFAGITGLVFSMATLALVWNIFTGTTVLGMDVLASIQGAVTGLGNAGFVGLITLVLAATLLERK